VLAAGEYNSMYWRAQLIFVTAAFGGFFLWNGRQSYHHGNFAGQFCVDVDGCTHPEWFIVGALLLIGAGVMYKVMDPWQ
jgi:hypothetical protein